MPIYGSILHKEEAQLSKRRNNSTLSSPHADFNFKHGSCDVSFECFSRLQVSFDLGAGAPDRAQLLFHKEL